MADAKQTAVADFKGTPGPWRTSRTDLESYTVNKDGETDDAVHVVYVYRSDAPRIPVFADLYADNARADARLIAAAPDLLAACMLWDQGFVEGEQFDPAQFLAWVNANRRAARVAIAKARGD